MIGAYGGYPLLHRFFKEEKVQAVERLYQRYGVCAILIAAFTPIPYKVFTIASGVFRYNLLVMMGVSVVGREARFFLVAYLVQWFGASILQQFDRVLLVGTVLLIVGAAGYLYWRSRYGKVSPARATRSGGGMIPMPSKVPHASEGNRERGFHTTGSTYRGTGNLTEGS